MLPSTLGVLLALAAEAPLPAPPARWVEDGAQFLSPAARDALDARLEGYERATGHQVVVWIGRTLGGAPLDDWAVRTFANWKVGRKGIDDGLVMFILADDHAVDIEVGYGLEEKVPDVVGARIIREVMTPRLRAGDRDGAVTAGVEALLSAVEGHPWEGSGGAPARRSPSPIEIVLGLLALAALAVLFVTHPRLAMFFMWTILSGGGRGRGSGFGGPGGFRGGGGRSGGGGARGHW